MTTDKQDAFALRRLSPYGLPPPLTSLRSRESQPCDTLGRSKLGFNSNVKRPRGQAGPAREPALGTGKNGEKANTLSTRQHHAHRRTAAAQRRRVCPRAGEAGGPEWHSSLFESHTEGRKLRSLNSRTSV